MTEERTFRIGPIRPPSESASLLIQVTRGCTWNRCRFCNLYRDTGFKAYDVDSVKRDIDAIAACAEEIKTFFVSGRWDLEGLNERLAAKATDAEAQSFHMVAHWLLNGGENVFLQDGNTTALSGGKLSDVLVYLKETFPNIRRITSYGRAEELSKHDAEYFAELKEAGLDRIHSGFETGSDKVLERINKGTTSDHEIRAGKAVRAGGIELSVYFMPGIGGKDLTRENAEGTARVINEVGPDFLRIRTAAIKYGTELYEDYRSGKFQLCSDDDKVREIRRVIELAHDIETKVVSDHMVNLLQDINGSLGAGGDRPGHSDRAEMLRRIDRYLDLPGNERRVYQFLRRTLRAYDLDEMDEITQEQMKQLIDMVASVSDREWDEKMNGYISRYI